MNISKIEFPARIRNLFISNRMVRVNYDSIKILRDLPNFNNIFFLNAKDMN